MLTPLSKLSKLALFTLTLVLIILVWYAVWSTKDAIDDRQLLYFAANHPLQRVAFSPNDSFLAALDTEGFIYILSTSSNKPLNIFHQQGSTAIAFNAQSGTIISGGSDGIVQMWDIQSGREVASVKVIEPVVSNILTRGSNGELQRDFEGIFDIALTLDGKYLAVGGVDGQVILVELPSLKVVHSFRSHSYRNEDLFYDVSIVNFDDSGTLLSTASDDGTINVWSVPEGKQVCSLKSSYGRIMSLAFSPRQRKITTFRWPTYVDVWLVDTCHQTFEGNASLINPSSVDITGDGNRFVRSGDNLAGRMTGMPPFVGQNDTGVYFQDGVDFENLLIFRGHELLVTDVQISNNECFIASVSEDKTLRLWDIHDFCA